MGEGGGATVAKVAVVTGAASGIGLALVEGLLGDSTSVVMADVDEKRLGTEAARLRAQGADVLDAVVDVADPASVDDLARRTFDRFGRVDMLCNNAGTIAFGPAWELALADWDRVLRVNLLSVVNGIRSFVPIMRRSGDDGRIVNTASMAAFMQLGGVAPYVATKHAVVGRHCRVRIVDGNRATAGVPPQVRLPRRR
jgi:NAD(P)-dependent dehydrogenase (short-subunit alcohol dehydrogenase family)